MRHKKQKQVESCTYCGTGYPHTQCPAYSKMCGGCGKTNHIMAVHRSMQGQQQGQKLQRCRKSIHEVRQDEESHQLMQEQHNRSSDSVNINYLSDNVKPIIFPKPESSTSQRTVHITYKTDA